MYKLIVIAIIMALGACTEPIPKPQLATTRLCDTVSYYIATISNPSPRPIKAKYIVYADTNSNKAVESGEPVVYRSPIVEIGRINESMSDHIPIDTLWNKYTLITELQTTYGDMIKDHVYPCERHLAPE